MPFAWVDGEWGRVTADYFEGNGLIGTPASDGTPPQPYLCVPRPTVAVGGEGPAATDANDADAKDAADAPSEVSDGDVSSAETDTTLLFGDHCTADTDYPFLLVGGVRQYTTLERAEERAQRRAKWLDSDVALEMQRQLASVYGDGEHDPRVPPCGAAAALWAKYGQSEEDARALLAAVEARYRQGEAPPKKRQKHEKHDHATATRSPMPKNAVCGVLSSP